MVACVNMKYDSIWRAVEFHFTSMLFKCGVHSSSCFANICSRKNIPLMVSRTLHCFQIPTLFSNYYRKLCQYNIFWLIVVISYTSVIDHIQYICHFPFIGSFLQKTIQTQGISFENSRLSKFLRSWLAPWLFGFISFVVKINEANLSNSLIIISSNT